MKRKLGIFILALCLWIGLPQAADTAWAADGATSVSVSSGNVNIGDTVTVTVKASGPSGEKANATMTLSYDANVLQFVSCSTTYGGGGGSVIATGESYTVTLKAVGAGNSAISVSGSDGVIFDTNEEMGSMSGSSTSVTVNNAAGGATAGGTATGNATAGGTAGAAGTAGSAGNGTQSADNSLKSLTISPGTLSPAFSGKTTTYSATVGSDVSSIAVSATPANDKATVESVTGNTDLKAGANTIKIVVKAENGVTATYTINVTKQGGSTAQTTASEETESTPEETETTGENVTVNGIAYQITEDFTAEDIPVDFTENTINYHGTDYKGVSYDKGAVSLLWMVPVGAEEVSGQFFVYDATRDTCYPFVKMNHGDKYVIALLAPIDFTTPENYLQTELVLEEGNSIAAYQMTQEEETELVSEFYLFYAVNSDGTEGWYQYDALEETYQRTSVSVSEEENETDNADASYLEEEYAALSDKYAKERSFSRNVIGILVFVLAVLVIVIINLLLHRFQKKDDDFDEADADEDDEDLSGNDFEEPARRHSIFRRRPVEDDLEDDEDITREISALKEKPEQSQETEKPITTEKSVTTEEPVTTEKAEEPQETEKPVARQKTGRKEKPKAGKTEDDDLEIIDFNDL